MLECTQPTPSLPTLYTYMARMETRPPCHVASVRSKGTLR